MTRPTAGDRLLGDLAELVGGVTALVGILQEHAVVLLWAPGLVVALLGWTLKHPRYLRD